MTTREAADRLEWTGTTVRKWAVRAGILPMSKAYGIHARKAGKGTRHDFTEADIQTLVRAQRETFHRISAAKSAEIKRVNPSQFRDPIKLRAIARRHLKLAYEANARRSARRRVWREKHDV